MVVTVRVHLLGNAGRPLSLTEVIVSVHFRPFWLKSAAQPRGPRLWGQPAGVRRLGCLQAHDLEESPRFPPCLTWKGEVTTALSSYSHRRME